MMAPSGFQPKHLREQPRRLALRNVREIGDKTNRIAALSPVAKSHQRPLYRLTLKLPRLRSARRGLSATISRPIILPLGKSLFRTAGKAASAARLISPKSVRFARRRLGNCFDIVALDVESRRGVGCLKMLRKQIVDL